MKKQGILGNDGIGHERDQKNKEDAGEEIELHWGEGRGNGGVQGYCWRIDICGTVQPLSWKNGVGKIGLCGQGSCWSHLCCCSVASASC